MAGAGENLRKSQRKKSGSKEETKGRNQDLGPSESDERTDRRHERDPRSSAEKRENEDSRLRRNEAGQIRDHRESDAEIQRQKRLRYFEIQERRIHETESRSLPQKKRGKNLYSGLRINEAGGIRDQGESEADILQRQILRDVEMQQKRIHETESISLPLQKTATGLDWVWGRNLSKRVFDERTLIHELAQSSESKRVLDERILSEYIVRPGERDCQSYVNFGLCTLGRRCLFNHPRCKFFLRGACEKGSACRFLHPKDRGFSGIPVRQGREAQENVQKQTHRDIELQRIEAGENLEEQRLKVEKLKQDLILFFTGIARRKDEPGQRDAERHERESEESVEEKRSKAKTIPDSQVHESFEETIRQITDEIVERIKRAKMAKATLNSRGPERFKDITQRSQIHDEIVAGYIRARMENRSVTAQENLAEQRPGNIEMQRREAEKSVEEQILKEKHAHDNPNQEEQRSRDGRNGRDGK